MANELANIAAGIADVERSSIPDTAVSRANRVNNFIGFSVIPPDFEFDELDEYEEIYEGKYVEIIDDPSRQLETRNQESTELSIISKRTASKEEIFEEVVEQCNPFNVKRTTKKYELCIYEQEITGCVGYESETNEDDELTIIDGEYRELHDDEEIDIVRQTAVYLIEDKNVCPYVIVDKEGVVIPMNNTECNSLFVNKTGMHRTHASYVVNSNNILAAYVSVTVAKPYSYGDKICSVLSEECKFDVLSLINLTADYKRRLVISGYLPNVQVILDYFNLEPRKVKIGYVNLVPPGSSILLRLDPSVENRAFMVQSTEYLRNCTLVELTSRVPGLDEVSIPIDCLSIANKTMIIAGTTSSLDRVYYVDGDFFILSLNKAKKEQFNFKLYKALALCYFGLAGRNAVWKGLKQTSILYNIDLPAAAYMCPIEYLQGIQYECILSYLDNLFRIQRPISGQDGKKILLSLRKATKLSVLVELLLALPTAREPYPVSTIGLFAGDCVKDDMLRQIAGSDDAELNKQLVQELTQLLLNVEPKSLSALLVSHRSDLDTKQKSKAIKVLKKYLSTDEDDFEKFDKKYKKVGKNVVK